MYFVLRGTRETGLGHQDCLEPCRMIYELFLFPLFRRLALPHFHTLSLGLLGSSSLLSSIFVADISSDVLQ